MASCSSNMNCRQRKQFPLERRPARMLKDFLLDQDSNSCPSNGFKSFQRKPYRGSVSSVRNLIQMDLNCSSHAQQRLQRSRSKAASTTISAVQAMINAVIRNINFASVKSPSILPRTLSRKLSKKKSRKEISETEITVRIKDIIRWKSFRDLAEEKSPSPNFGSSPPHCTTATATATTTTTASTCTSCSSNGSSWCDSDFTAEYLPSDVYGENEVDVVGKKFSPCVGKDSADRTTEEAANTAAGPKEKNHGSEEKDQHSPHSVLDFEYEGDDEGTLSSFIRSLATMERKSQKLMQNIQRFENLAKLDPVNLDQWMSLEETKEDDIEEQEQGTNEVEEKAWELLKLVKGTSSLKSCIHIGTGEKLLLDLFKEELSTKWNDQTKNEAIESEMVREANAWLDGELETVKWGVEDKREAYVRDMDREGKWSKFKEEQEELAWDVESWVVNVLVDELSMDLHTLNL